MVNDFGGKGFWAQADHTDIAEVDALFDRVIREQGRVDIVVNSICGNVYQWGNPFWLNDLPTTLASIDRGARAHIITAQLAARHMVAANSGLIVSISDADANDSVAYACERSLNQSNISHYSRKDCDSTTSPLYRCFPAVFFACFDVMTEEQLRLAIEREPTTVDCHTPRLIGRAKRLADLGDAEGKLEARAIENVTIVGERCPGRFRDGDRPWTPHPGRAPAWLFKHQVKRARARESTDLLAGRARNFYIMFVLNLSL